MIKATLIDTMGSDLSVVNAARVSFGKTSEWDQHLVDHVSFSKVSNTLKEKDRALIKYLAHHKHTSPFGHCFASFHVKAPIFVARQLVKHKFLRWNEVSGRYVDFTKDPETGNDLDEEDVFYQIDEYRGKPDNVKQGSAGVILDEDGYPKLEFYSYGTTGFTDLGLQEQSLMLYKQMLKEGVCNEQARSVLPQSLMTEWWWSGSLDAFADMCNLRCYPDAQYETRIVADEIDKLMGEKFPVSWKALRQ